MKKSVIDGETVDGVNIERNSLIQSNCNQGRHKSLECYRILVLFTTYYNK